MLSWKKESQFLQGVDGLIVKIEIAVICSFTSWAILF